MEDVEDFVVIFEPGELDFLSLQDTYNKLLVDHEDTVAYNVSKKNKDVSKQNEELAAHKKFGDLKVAYNQVAKKNQELFTICVKASKELDEVSALLAETTKRCRCRKGKGRVMEGGVIRADDGDFHSVSYT